LVIGVGRFPKKRKSFALFSFSSIIKCLLKN
jgi:hypothetical protein